MSKVSQSLLNKYKEPLQDSIILSKNELNRVKENARILDKSDLQRLKDQSESSRAEKIAISKARKSKMLELEEERRKKAPILSDLEAEQQAINRKLVAQSLKAVDEEKDAVKQMNQMILYAKCVAIRDSQLEEKKKIADQQAKENAKLDLMMEMDRVKFLKSQEEIEVKKAIEQKKGSLVIQHQIEEREKERRRQLEIKEQEAQQMLARIRDLELKEEQDRQNKVLQGKKLYKEVIAANQNQTSEKEKKKLENIEEDRRIAAYILEKERKEAEYEAEIERIHNEKEMEIARLRAAQEKAHDQQAELDALRAKRTQEAAERKWRSQQKNAAEKRQKMQEDLNRARQEQQLEKEHRLSEQAREERRIFERIIAVQREADKNEKSKADEEKELRVKHRNEIKQQIDARENAIYSKRHEKFDEGAKLRQNLLEEQNRLDDIKKAKIEALIRAGVPEKYTAELNRKKFMA